MKTSIVITNQNIDAHAALDLDSKLTQLPNNIKIVIDLTAVQSISVAGIGVISAAVRNFKKIILKGCNDSIFHKIDTLGLTQLVKIQ